MNKEKAPCGASITTDCTPRVTGVGRLCQVEALDTREPFSVGLEVSEIPQSTGEVAPWRAGEFRAGTSCRCDGRTGSIGDPFCSRHPPLYRSPGNRGDTIPFTATMDAAVTAGDHPRFQRAVVRAAWAHRFHSVPTRVVRYLARPRAARPRATHRRSARQARAPTASPGSPSREPHASISSRGRWVQ